MRKINYPILALIIANTIWGATSPIIKLALENIPPFSLAFIRFLLASLLLYPFIHKTAKYSDLKNKWLWIFSLCGVTLNIAFFFWAMQRTESINAPIIGSSGPIMVIIGSALFLKERAKLPTIIGTIISLLGVLIIIFEPLLQKGVDGNIIGNLFLIIATLGAVLATISGRKFLTPQNSLGTTFWSCFIGTTTFVPLMLAEFVQNPLWIADLDYRGIFGIAFGAIFSSTIAYGAADWALSKLPAYRVSIFAYLDPIVAIVIAIPLLGEKLTLPFIFGSIFVFLGILIAEKRLHYHPVHKLLGSSD